MNEKDVKNKSSIDIKESFNDKNSVFLRTPTKKRLLISWCTKFQDRKCNYKLRYVPLFSRFLLVYVKKLQ